MTPRITKETVLETLQQLVPEFSVDPALAEDCLGYPIIGDLARYICQEADISSYVNESDGYPDQVKKALSFLERCLEEGDPYVQNLAHECLDALLSCERIWEIKAKFGRLVLGLWNEFLEDIYLKNLQTRQP